MSIDNNVTFQNGSAFLSEDKVVVNAYKANYKAHKKGISHEEMVNAYSEWSIDYDKDLCTGTYNGPILAADAMAKFYEKMDDRRQIKILDVAAGTGRVGQELDERGFKNLDGLEPSSGMLQILIGRNIYKNTFMNSIGFEQIKDIESNAYDSLVIAGGMGEGHIPVAALDEMIRIVKPGGTIFIVMREEYLDYVEEYVGKLEPYMDSLTEQKKWERISRDIVPDYSFNKNGVVFLYRVI